MALPRTWLPRSAEIVEVLRRMKSPTLDRAAIEELFQLQRRAAQTLMKQAGASGDRGGAVEIERTSLLSWVERISREESWRLERRRAVSEELSLSMAEVQAVRRALVVAGRRPVEFPLVDEVLSTTCASLPSTVSITPGRITIDLSGDPDPVRACQLLLQLGMALANDFGGFTDRLRPREQR